MYISTNANLSLNANQLMDNMYMVKHMTVSWRSAGNKADIQYLYLINIEKQNCFLAYNFSIQ